MMAFRTQVMAVMTGLVIATAVALGAVLIYVWTGMMYRQVEGAGRGLASLLAAELDQQRELVHKLAGSQRPPPPPEEVDAVAPTRPRGAGWRGLPGQGPGADLEASLLELASIVHAQRIALVGHDRVLVSVTPEDAQRSDISDAEVVSLWKRLEGAEPGQTEVLESDVSLAVMTVLKSPGPSGAKPGLLVQLPKTLPRQIAGANATVLGLTVLLVAGVAVAAAWYLSRNISKPLSRLAATARSYGEGALDEAAPVTGPTETQRLGTVLNSMAASLKQHILNLEEETRRREKLESELRVAAELQRSLLPKPGLQRFGPVEVLGWSETAESVGGDFYDFRLVNPNTFAFIIGDATGKGMPAALLAAKCLSVLQALTEARTEPGELLRHANKLLWEQFRGQGRFVTAFLGIVDLPANRLLYARAGHNPPYMANGGEGAKALLSTQGLPLAVAEASAFDTAVLEFSPCDTLLLYTDGITEAHDAQGALYGDERLKEMLARHTGEPLPELLNALTSDVRQYSGHWPPPDDCTVLLMRFS